MLRSGEDLSIADILQDPMINAVMRADHVTRDELRTLLVSTAERHFGRSSESRAKVPAAGILQTMTRNLSNCQKAAW